MRIPLPERIRLKYVVIFAVLFFMVQQAESTDLLFSTICVVYIFVTAFAFNAAGGFRYPSGNWVFFNAMLVVIGGIVWKAVLGEPAQTNLKDPVGTILVETAGMMGILGTSLVNSKVRKKRPIFSGMDYGEPMRKAATGALILGLALMVFTYPSLTDQPGSLKTALRQLNHFTEMAVLLATFYQVRKTGGKKSSNWIVIVGVSATFLLGLVIFSKQGMLTGPFTWLVAAAVAGHNFTRKQLITIVAAGFFFQAYLVPLSQVGRGDKDANLSFTADVGTAWNYLTNLKSTRDIYRDDQAGTVDDTRQEEDVRYYNLPQGFIDRLSMIPPDDDLISFTNRGNVEGLWPTGYAFINAVPHFIWPNKPALNTGNSYAHEMGGLANDDDTTGISFSPAADSYHQAVWGGPFLLLPLTTFMLFYIMDSVSGDIRTAPWGVLYVVTIAHLAPEGGVGYVVYASTFTTATIATVFVFSKYILPIFGGIITNTERTRVRKGMEFRPAPRVNPLRPILTEVESPEIPL